MQSFETVSFTEFELIFNWIEYLDNFTGFQDNR